MLKLADIGMRIGGKQYYGVTNHRLRFWVQSQKICQKKRLERDGEVNACGPTGLTWFWASFLPVVLAILFDSWDCEC